MSATRPWPAELRIMLDNELRRMREIYIKIVCLIGREETAQRVFGSVYACEKWCAERQLVFKVSRLLPEGGFYLGQQEMLDGGDDAIEAMLLDVERTKHADRLQ
jgi:hypothetical protein